MSLTEEEAKLIAKALADEIENRLSKTVTLRSYTMSSCGFIGRSKGQFKLKPGQKVVERVTMYHSCGYDYEEVIE